MLCHIKENLELFVIKYIEIPAIFLAQAAGSELPCSSSRSVYTS